MLVISVDPPDKSHELANKLLLPFQLLSDQQHTVIDSYGVYDAAGRIAIPSTFVIDKNAAVRWLYIGKDNTDRPADDEILSAVQGN